MRGSWARAVVLIAVLAAATVATLGLGLPAAAAVHGWVEDAGTAGPVLLAVATGIVLVGPVPRTALSVLLGAVLGFWTGLAVALAGGLLGGLAAFTLSRTLGRRAAVRLAGPWFAAVDRVMADRGFGMVLAARLLPVMPFSVVSHAAGLSAAPLVAYTAATALGLLPSTALQVGLGTSVPELMRWAARAGSPGVVAAASAVVGAAVLLLLRWRRARTPVGGPS